jgi:hypothetical protein
MKNGEQRYQYLVKLVETSLALSKAIQNLIININVEFCFKSSSDADFKVKVKVRSRLLSVSSILYFKFTWIDAMQIITESRIVQ